MSNFIVIKTTTRNREYAKVVEPLGFGKGNRNVIGLGNTTKLTEINSNYLQVMKDKLKKIDQTIEPAQIKKILLKEIEGKYIRLRKNVGIQYIYDAIKELDIFSSFEKSKRKEQEAILQYQIATKMLNNQSIIKSFESKGKYLNSIDTKKDTFYELLDDLVKNEQSLMKKLNEQIIEKTKRNKDFLFFDSSTVYFESFQREGLKKPGYSKDGKFKEDQVVIGMATDNNGIPIYIDVMPGNTADSGTMIPFINKLKTFYNIKKITIIADKGMSTNNNLRKLEEFGYDYIISQRLLQSTKEFKKYVTDKNDYIQLTRDLRYKELEYESLFNKKEPNGVIRKRLITHSISRMKKDANDRDVLLNNFYKKSNNKGVVSSKSLVGSKKQKFYKQVGESHFILDFEKALEDEKYDGYYVYETTRRDLSPEEIINIYHHQWQIEENFRTLKGQLKVRPIFVRTDKHIRGHFILSFLSLVILKYLLFKVNKFANDNGVLYKMTNQKFITAINEANVSQLWLNDNLIESEPEYFEGHEEITNDYKWIEMALKK